MIEIGQLRRVVDSEGLFLGAMNDKVLLVIRRETVGHLLIVTVLVQDGTITKFTDHWLKSFTEVLDG